MGAFILSSTEYKNFFDTLSSLLDKQCMIRDQYQHDNDIRSLIEAMPYMISMTNTISCLRGQHHIFVDFRDTGSYQQHYYDQENIFEKKLSGYIETIRNSDEYDRYIHQLEQFFVKFRS